jgi:hypothetical protein
LFIGNFRNAVSKPKQSNADLRDIEDSNRPGWRGRARIDSRLASLYQGTLEEAIPDEMMRLVVRIGAQVERS